MFDFLWDEKFIVFILSNWYNRSKFYVTKDCFLYFKILRYVVHSSLLYESNNADKNYQTKYKGWLVFYLPEDALSHFITLSITPYAWLSPLLPSYFYFRSSYIHPRARSLVFSFPALLISPANFLLFLCYL